MHRWEGKWHVEVSGCGSPQTRQCVRARTILGIVEKGCTGSNEFGHRGAAMKVLLASVSAMLGSPSRDEVALSRECGIWDSRARGCGRNYWTRL